jgi:ketosteroid isomerase-like protein
VVVYHATAERAGERLDMHNVVLFRIRDGKIVEVTGLPADFDKQDAFWS